MQQVIYDSPATAGSMYYVISSSGCPDILESSSNMMHVSAKKLWIIAGGCIVVGTVIGGSLSLLWKSWSNNTNNDLDYFKSYWPFNFHSSKPFKSELIYVITREEEFKYMVSNFKLDLKEVKVLGLDCEWCSTRHGYKPVALMQLATVSGLCLLIRLCHYKGSLPTDLLDILKDPNVLKVGVGTYDDSKRLFRDHGIVVNGCIDLRDLVLTTSVSSQQDNQLSLKGLALTYANVRMEKSKSIQCSNWEAALLSDKQVCYAANDALIAVSVFSKIMLERFCLNSNLQTPIKDAINDTLWTTTMCYCDQLRDIKFKVQKRMKPQSNVGNNKENNGSNETKPLKSYSSRKFPLYDNCKLQAPDGQLLSTCDRKKTAWYLSKGLADVVSEDPYIIRLRFEPAGRPSSEQEYYLHDKKNICVVCGSSGPIVRKNVVPHEYRRHFPLALKDHISHDVVPVCVSCHQRAGFHDQDLRSKIADEYDAPIRSIPTVRLLEDPERRSVRSAGRALSSSGHRIPEPRKSALEAIIKNFFNVEIITNDVLLEASQLETRYSNESYVNHGEKVVSQILSKEKIHGLMNFERRWREHFLNKLKPSYLPYLWSVEHNHDKVYESILNQEIDTEDS